MMRRLDLALRTRAELVARWDISKMRREVDAAWPAVGVVPRAPTRGWVVCSASYCAASK